MMLAPLLTALLILAQPAPETAAPPPPSPRLEAALAELKGKPATAFTAKLGPATSTRKATDGQVLYWTINVPGETVCGGDASGSLVCQRQGGGDCLVAAAFKADGLMSAWRTSGLPAACEKAADQLKPAG